jgi:pyruvate/2-oxoglutarate dehydrogenase complex dihydrolipoamide acyltransferase (E2) component
VLLSVAAVSLAVVPAGGVLLSSAAGVGSTVEVGAEVAAGVGAGVEAGAADDGSGEEEALLGVEAVATDSGAAATRWPRRRWLVELGVAGVVTTVPAPPETLTVGTDVVAGTLVLVLGAGTTTGAGAVGRGGGGSVLTTIGAAEIACARPPITPDAAPAAEPAGAGMNEYELRWTGAGLPAARRAPPWRTMRRVPADPVTPRVVDAARLATGVLLLR